MLEGAFEEALRSMTPSKGLFEIAGGIYMFHQAINSAYRPEMQSLFALFLLLNKWEGFSREGAKPLRAMVIDDAAESHRACRRTEIQLCGQIIVIARSEATRQSRASCPNHQRVPHWFATLRSQ